MIAGGVTRQIEILSVVDDGLGHSSYLVGLGDGTALVVDPARFPDQQRQLADGRGWRIAWTADTHSHADYISGSPELASDGAAFLASRGAGLEIPHQPVDAGTSLQLAPGVTLRAIATPGHTPDHLAYLLEDDGQPRALFSGGSLMVGALGRTDLLGENRAGPLARELFRALRGEIMTLPDDLPVYPTHGAGSFCSAPQGAARTTTIGAERATNPLLRLDDEDTFVKELLSGLGSFPTYFRMLPERNRRGPRLYPKLPALPSLDLKAVDRLTADGAALVDARSTKAFSDGHIPGSISIQLRPVFASWLGWLIDLDRPVVFVLDDETDRAELVRQCLTIGHESLAGELSGGVATWTTALRPLESIPLVGVDATATLLDVRQDGEWASGHVPGALHAELANVGDVDLPEQAITVMCGHGERAMTGASLLALRGFRDLSVFAGGPGEWSAATGRALTSE